MTLEERIEKLEDSFIDYLEENSIDTLCFMGHGYDLEDVNVGATFYMSYRYITKLADFNRDTFDNVIKGCKVHSSYTLTDKWKLISKYKYFDRTAIDHKNRTTHPIRVRDWHVQIKNLRTNETVLVHEDNYSDFYLFCFETW